MQLEDFRQSRLHDLSILIQKTFRGWSARNRYLKMKQSQRIIAAAWRRYKVIKYQSNYIRNHFFVV